MGVDSLTHLLEIGYRIIVMCAYNHRTFDQGWRLVRNHSQALIKKDDLALLCNTDTVTSKTTATAARAALQKQHTDVIREIKFGHTVSDEHMIDKITAILTSPLLHPTHSARRSVLVITDPERVKPLAHTLAKHAHHPGSSKVPTMSIRPCGTIIIEKTGITYTDAIRV